MTSRERVLEVLHGRRPDRVPLNVFAGWNPEVRAEVEARYGSVAAFESEFGIDIVTGVLPRFPYGRRRTGTSPDDGTDEFPGEAGADLPDDLEGFLDLEPLDPKTEPVCEMPCDGDLFQTVAQAVETAGDRAIFAHAWGVFELSQFLFERDGRPGTQEALLNMLAEQDVCREIFARLGAWTADCVEAAIDAGVDVIELSDDWGQQNTMLFSPDLWWDLIFVPTQTIVRRASSRNVPVLIHTDGDVTLVLDGIRDLQIQGLHPVQESAGMDVAHVRSVLGSSVCIMGGLDTVSVLPRLNAGEVGAEVDRIFGLLKDSGPFIFAGSHMFQNDTPLDRIEAAYRRANEVAWFGRPENPHGL